MKKAKKISAIILAGLALATGATVGALVGYGNEIMTEAATAVENPKELLLGMFFNSQKDQSDTLYVSFDGTNFEMIGIALKDRAPQDETDNVIDDPNVESVKCLHDPCLQYHNGYYWSMSGFVRRSGDREGTFQPMLTYSPDLINWSYPNSGGTDNNTNTSISPSILPYGREGERDNTDFECAAPGLFIDDDGTGWIIACLGYYAKSHGDYHKDVMSPYIIKAENLRPGTTEVPTTFALKNKVPLCTYSDAYPVNLEGATSTNYIDSEIYKENGVYYLALKRDSTITEIWKTDTLGLDSKWTLVCPNVVDGFEGPSLTYFAGRYRCYTDKLTTGTDSSKGVFVTESDKLESGWENTHRIVTKTIGGDIIPNRHGSVLRITDPDQISRIMDIYRQNGGGYPVNIESLTVNAESFAVNVGDTYALEPKLMPEQAEGKVVIKWTSSDPSVATVDSSGNVKGIKSGTATITAEIEGVAKAVSEVTVESVDVIGIKMKMVTQDVRVDETVRLEAKIEPSDATNKKVSWSSADESIATVDENGVVNGIKIGVADITVKTDEGNKSSVCSVYVNGNWADDFTGVTIYDDKAGEGYYSRKGRFTPSFSGVTASAEGQYYYVKDGLWDTSFTGLARNADDGEYYYMENGVWNSSYSGPAISVYDGNIYYAKNGKWNRTYTGLAKHPNGKWYYFKDGKHIADYTGMATSTNKGLYYVTNGLWNNRYTGLGKYTDGKWYYAEKGIYNNKYTGISVSTDNNLYFVENGNWSRASAYVGLAKYAKDGKWYYVKNGVHVSTYNGIAKSTNAGMYYVTNGQWNKKYTGLAKYTDDNWYYVKNGVYDKTYKGMAASTDGNKYFVNNGKWDTTYTGLAKFTDGKWYFAKNGRYNDSYTGITGSTSGGNLFYAKNGQWDKTYTGLAKNTDGKWYYVKAGTVDKSYTGLARSTDSKMYFVKNGIWDDSYTGLARHTNGKWYYVRKGAYIDSYTGISVSTDGKLYYVKDGSWDTSYTGLAKYTDGKWYYVQNGRHIPTYTGAALSTDGNYYYVMRGVWDTSFTGPAKATDGTVYYFRSGRLSPFNGIVIFSESESFYLLNGMLDRSYNGIAKAEDGKWYYVKNGMIDKTYTGIAKSTDGNLYYVTKGVWDTESLYIGLAKNPSDGKWYYVKSGRHVPTYTGMAKSTNGSLYYVKNGQWDTSYTGLAKYTDGEYYYVDRGIYKSDYTGISKSADAGQYYVTDGKWNRLFNGEIEQNGTKYTIRSGRVV